MKKQVHEYTGDVVNSQCETCGLIANYDLDECPEGCNK